MSFDLAAWSEPIPRTAMEARGMFDRHNQGTPTLRSGPSVERFRAELLSRYPSLEEATRDSPWAMTPQASDTYVELNLAWRAPDQVLLDIVDLARRHRIVLYDPQGPDVHAPAGTPRSGGAPRRRLMPLLIVGVVVFWLAVAFIGLTLARPGV